MQSLQSQHHLANIQSSFFFVKALPSCDSLTQIATRVVIHNEKQSRWRLEGISQSHHERMVQSTHHIPLSHSVSPQVIGGQSCLLQHFHSQQSLLSFATHQKDLSKRSTSQNTQIFEALKRKPLRIEYLPMETVGSCRQGHSMHMILPILPVAMLEEQPLQIILAAVSDRSGSLPILAHLTPFFQQKHDDLPMTILSCEVQGCITIRIISIKHDSAVSQCPCHFIMPPQSCKVQPISIVSGYCIYSCSLFAEQPHHIGMSLIAGKVQRRPLIQSPAVYFHRIPILPIRQQVRGFIIEPFLTVGFELVVVVIHIGPKLMPTAQPIRCDLLSADGEPFADHHLLLLTHYLLLLACVQVLHPETHYAHLPFCCLLSLLLRIFLSNN